MSQTTFYQEQLHQPKSVMNPSRDVDVSTWIWTLAVALIISAAINVFNLGRQFEKRSIVKK